MQSLKVTVMGSVESLGLPLEKVVGKPYASCLHCRNVVYTNAAWNYDPARIGCVHSYCWWEYNKGVVLDLEYDPVVQYWKRRREEQI